jgi:hypothetical protein
VDPAVPPHVDALSSGRAYQGDAEEEDNRSRQCYSYGEAGEYDLDLMISHEFFPNTHMKLQPSLSILVVCPHSSQLPNLWNTSGESIVCLAPHRAQLNCW